VILVLLLSASPFTFHPGEFAFSLVYELVAGAAIGVAAGWLGSLALVRLALPASGLYPLAIFGIGMVAFAAAGSAHASGFLAAYLAALVLGNTGLPHRAATRSFAEGLGWLAQIGLFVLLGLLVDPSELLGQLVPALVIGAVLLLVARPLSVVSTLLPFRVPIPEQLFLSFAGLRGAVPIVLATFPIVEDVEGSGRVLNIVFVLVVLFTLVQGPTLAPLARALKLAPGDGARHLDVEAAPLDVLDAELLTVTIQANSRLDSVSVLELRLPERSVITLIIRGERSLVPDATTRLRVGDQMLIVTSRRQREATEQRLRAVSRRGALARWFGDHGDDDA
jgi:cell volume regulation protein A